MRKAILVAAGLFLLAAVPTMVSAQAQPQGQTEAPFLGPPMFDRWPERVHHPGPWARHGRGPGFGYDHRFGLGMARRFGPRAGRHLSLGRIARDPALRERLGITDEQAAKIEAAQSQFAKQQIQRQAELRIKRMELAELLRAENPDRAAIEKKLRELNDLELQAKMAGLDHGMAMRNLLTPEQREQLKQLARERVAQRFQGRRGLSPRPQRGPGMGPRGPQAPPPPPRQPQPPPAE